MIAALTKLKPQGDNVKDLSVTKLDWRKSSLCESSGCVEVAFGESGIAVRDSKMDSGPVLTFSADSWRAFLDGLRSGDFELN